MHVEGGKVKAGCTGFLLAIVGAGVMLAALAMVFLVAPREATMGDVQRIFYFHVAFAWVGFLAFLVTGVSGALYLVWRAQGLDWLGSSSAEVGLVFISAALLAGSLWARLTWGTYWTREPRLTISALQWLVYAAYLMLRRAVDDPQRRARLGAVYGITDELHQYFVPSRSAEGLDALADALGSFLGAWLYARVARLAAGAVSR